MKPVLLLPFALIAGSGAAVGGHLISQALNPPPAPQLREAMLEQPLEQGPGNIADVQRQPPEGILPADATPTLDPRGNPTPHSRPVIQLKPSWLPAWLGGNSDQRNGAAELVLTRSTNSVATTKDPIWVLQLKQGDQVLASLPALSGRANRQQLDRHTSGNKSPLPPGRYAIDRNGIARAPFSDPELGSGYWIPIQPLFRTGRSDLGLHQDPSWGLANGESGTSGCIGLESADATAEVVNWIKHFNIRQLSVSS